MLALALKLGKVGLQALARGLPRNTIVSKMLRPAFGLATGVAAGAAGTAMVSQGGGLPALPGTSFYGQGVPLPSQMPRVGTLPFWRGPGGKFQLPWNDPKTPEFLKQYALDDAYLKPCYRAPKGYVVLRDPSGKPYCVLKQAAKMFGLWKPARKPPISAGDWHKYQTAERVVKRLRHIANKGLARKVSKQFAHPHMVTFKKKVA